ncbi:MAG: hypothetical protein ACQES9_10365, partial [Myxococcota bacterium]
QIRSSLLENLHSFGSKVLPIPENFSFGEESRFSLDTATLAAEMKPDADSVKIFIDNINRGTVWITSSTYYSMLRTMALNKTLENPELSAKLAKIWNNETSSRDQWQKTRKFWQPELLKEVNHFKNCKEDNNCLTPNELYRLKLLKLLYHHLNYKLLAKFLPQIKKLNILKQLSPPEFLKNNPEFVSKPWSKKVEKVRLEAASELVYKNKHDFKQIEKFMFKCKNRPGCYAKILQNSSKLKLSTFVKTKLTHSFSLLATRKNLDDLVKIYNFATNEERKHLVDLIWDWKPKYNSPSINKLKQKIKKLERGSVDLLNNLKLKIYLYQIKKGYHYGIFQQTQSQRKI